MHIFVTGGSGLTGPTIVSELITAGHRVTGLARSALQKLYLCKGLCDRRPGFERSHPKLAGLGTDP